MVPSHDTRVPARASVMGRLTLLCLVLAGRAAGNGEGALPSPDSLPPIEALSSSGSEIPDLAALESIRSQSLGPSPVLNLAPPEKRLFGVIPNYRAGQIGESYKPLSKQEKYEIARKDSFDWPNYFLLAGYAAQSQLASGGFRQNGGFNGFAKFYSRSIGDQIIGSYMVEAVMPSLLHEDPRFFRMGMGPLFRRATYAASRVFITRMDDGRSRFNISEVAGNASVVALTTLYYPYRRPASEGLERFGMQIGNDMISNLLTEFWPDIKRHLPFRHMSWPHSNSHP